MIKCEVIEKFCLKDFDKLKNIKRKGAEVKGTLFVGDTFDCDEEMAKYLTGNNALKKVVVKVVEIIPKKDKGENIIPLDEENIKTIADTVNKAVKKTTKKKNSKK